MYLINRKAAHLFRPEMTYTECAKVFREAGHGDIPLGEYLLMLGMATYAQRKGIPFAVMASVAQHYNEPFVFEPSVAEFEEL